MRNDLFTPFPFCFIERIELNVFNRWGQEVFSSNDATNPGWDGMVNDKPAPADVYIWRIRVGIGDTVLERDGQVTLIR